MPVPSLLRPCLLVLMLVSNPIAALAADLAPSAAFAQVGAGERGVRAYTGGLVWDGLWRKDLGWADASAYLDLALARWHSDGAPGDGSAWFTQAGITPVLRLRPDALGGAWFFEAGIGANLVTPTYQNRERRFSTRFNFGDHLGVGRSFGAAREHELALRFQHFSNGGFRRPNPGENFLQLRYTRHF